MARHVLGLGTRCLVVFNWDTHRNIKNPGISGAPGKKNTRAHPCVTPIKPQVI